MFPISRMRRPADRARESLRQALDDYAPHRSAASDEAAGQPESAERRPPRPRYIYRTNFELCWGSQVEQR